MTQDLALLFPAENAIRFISATSCQYLRDAKLEVTDAVKLEYRISQEERTIFEFGDYGVVHVSSAFEGTGYQTYDNMSFEDAVGFYKSLVEYYKGRKDEERK